MFDMLIEFVKYENKNRFNKLKKPAIKPIFRKSLILLINLPLIEKIIDIKKESKMYKNEFVKNIE